MVDLMKGGAKVKILSKNKSRDVPHADYKDIEQGEAETRKINDQNTERNWTHRFHDCLYCPLRSIPLQDGVTFLHQTRQVLVVYNNKV